VEGLATLPVPARFEPSLAGRPWLDLARIRGVPVWAVFAAILPALVLTALLFFDHNISSILAQRSEANLRKPPSFHWDFFLLGISVFLTGLLGLPPNYGLIPQAPLHTRALADIREVREGPLAREVWVRVCETRVSALLQSVLILCLLSDRLLFVLALIPRGVLAGLFLYLGLAGARGNGIVARVHFLCMDGASRVDVGGVDADAHWSRTASLRSILVLSAVQLVVVGAIFGITLTPGGIAFPVLIVLLVPLRLFMLPRLLPPAHLQAMDAFIVDAAAEGAKRADTAPAVGALHQDTVGDPCPPTASATVELSSVGLETTQATVTTDERL
jgi:hypothetical protein